MSEGDGGRGDPTAKPIITWNFAASANCVKCGYATGRFVNGTPIHRICEEERK